MTTNNPDHDISDLVDTIRRGKVLMLLVNFAHDAQVLIAEEDMEGLKKLEAKFREEFAAIPKPKD